MTQTRPDLSINARGQIHPDLSIMGAGKTRPDLSIVAGGQNHPDLSIVAIEKKRRAAGVSVTKLLGAAGVDRETWRQARRNPAATRRSTLTRLAAALERCTTPAAGLPETLFRLVLGLLAEEAALDLELVYLMACDFSAEKPQDPTWLAMARLRRIAMYIITVEIEVGNAVLARAIGCSRQNVKQARDVVEGWREDNPKVAVQIARVAGLARRV